MKKIKAIRSAIGAIVIGVIVNKLSSISFGEFSPLSIDSFSDVITSITNFALGKTFVDNWFLMLLVLMAFVVAIYLLREILSLLRNQPLELPVSGEYFGLMWRWELPLYNHQDLNCFCLSCDYQLLLWEIDVCRSDRSTNGLLIQCPHCQASYTISHRSTDKLTSAVSLLIEKNIRAQSHLK